MANFFTSKKGVKIIAVSLALTVVAVTSISVMVPSYLDYQKYYSEVMSEREHQKYLDSLPLEFLGIEAKLNDGVEYFTDGKANPENDDFSVIAKFTEKGKDFEKVLRSDDFAISCPDDFAAKGGKIEVSYTYTPEAKEDEQVEPITKTAEVEVSLTKVAIKELKVTELPYRIYYSSDMEFDPSGMKLQGIFNNGHVVDLTANDISVETKGKLTSGLKEAKVSYEVEGIKVETNVPVTVINKDEYSDGEILSIANEGEVFANEGENVTNLNLNIRATYLNGNRLILNKDQYIIKSNVETASFLYNCVLSVYLKTNETINCKLVAGVKYFIEAEETTFTGFNKKEIKVNEQNIKVLEDAKNGNTMSFKINSKGLSKGKLYMNLSNLTKEDILLDNIIDLKINDKYYPVTSYVKANEDYNFENNLLILPVLKNGENDISLTFKNMDNKKISIDNFTYITKYDGEIYTDLDQYLDIELKNNRSPNLTVSKFADWHNNNGAYGHGLCSDGEFIYSTRTGYSESTRAITVNKYDIKTGKLVASSPKTEAGSLESCAGVTYYEGKIIVYFADGRMYSIDKSLSGTWTLFEDFKFEKLEKSVFKDVYFNTSKRKFAVFADSNVYVYNNDKKLATTISLNKEAGSLKRISGSNNYIFALFTNNGSYQPIVQVYDWNGKFVGRMVVNNNSEVMGSVVTNLQNTNCQGIVEVNDQLYFNVLKFSTANGGDQTLMIKADYPKFNEKLNVVLNAGEYVDYSITTGQAVSLTGKPVNGNYGLLDGTSGGYSMGGASDGKYLYLAVNTNGNYGTTLFKVDPVSYEVIAKSLQFSVGDVDGDNSRLFIKDGVLYCIGHNNKIFSIELSKFEEKCKVTESTLTFSELGTLQSAYYNENIKKFALMIDGKVVITDENKNVLVDNISLALNQGGFSVSSLTADDKYIYVSYVRNNANNVPFKVFTWDGKLVSTTSINGVTLGTNGTADRNFNLQTVFTHNDKIYASVCSWDNGSKYYLFSVDFDTTNLE